MLSRRRILARDLYGFTLTMDHGEKREIRYTYVRDKGAADGGGSGENLAGHHGAMLRKWKERSERTFTRWRVKGSEIYRWDDFEA